MVASHPFSDDLVELIAERFRASGIAARRKQRNFVYYRIADEDVLALCDAGCGSMTRRADSLRGLVGGCDLMCDCARTSRCGPGRTRDLHGVATTTLQAEGQWRREGSRT